MNSVVLMIFTVSNAVMWLGTWLDAESSLDNTHAGIRESTRVLRDRDGYFSLKRYLLLTLLLWVPSIIATVRFWDTKYANAYALVISAALLFAGVRRIEVTLRNRKLVKEREGR